MKKKKQRPRKSTKSKQKNVPMKTVTQALTPTGTETERLQDDLMMSRWLSEHQLQVEDLLKKKDVDRSGSVTEEDFQLGLLELGVPCTNSQLHILTEKLKTGNNSISYQDLGARLKQLRLRDGADLDTQISSEQDKQREDVSSEKLDPKERFIRLRVRMIPFDSAAHPGSFEVVLSVSRSVLSLMWIIQDRVGVQTSQLKVFRSRLTTEEACLSPLSSLEECGFKGGSETCPTEATVYYDYALPRTDCPVLNCDHYFTTPKSHSTVA